MHDDPFRTGRADRQERRRRRAERRRRRRENAEEVAETGGEAVGTAGDAVDLAAGGVPTPGFGGGGGRGGGRCDGCDGFGRLGGGGHRGGGGGCDACDCNVGLLQLALLPLLGAVPRRSRAGAGSGPGRRTGRARRRPAPIGPRLSSVLLVLSVVLPDAAAGPVAAAIRLYRRRWSRYTPACPGTPSCSAYALAAVMHLGARRGLRVAAQRLRACGPAG